MKGSNTEPKNVQQWLLDFVAAYGDRHYVTLHFLAERSHYSMSSIQTALRDAVSQRKLLSYEHVSFPHRSIYVLPEQLSRVPDTCRREGQ